MNVTYVVRRRKAYKIHQLNSPAGSRIRSSETGTTGKKNSVREGHRQACNHDRALKMANKRLESI